VLEKMNEDERRQTINNFILQVVSPHVRILEDILIQNKYLLQNAD
jgi:hypothetical protein